jgi:uncharacterized protein YjbI with pentapeptide repeats
MLVRWLRWLLNSSKARGSRLRRRFLATVLSLRARQVVWTLFLLASGLWALIFVRRPVHELTTTLTMTGGLLVLVLVVYLLPPALVPSTAKVEDADRLKAVGDVRTALVQALGGAAVVGTLYFTAVSLQDSRINTNHTLDLNRQTLDINRQGQIADRFTRAVAQLGDAALDVRVGGIYALEQVARDATEDRTPIVEILTSYLQEHDPWQPGATAIPLPQQVLVGPPSTALRADFQAVVTVLGRRVRNPSSPDYVNLVGVDLRGGDLHDAHFEGANLGDAHLEGATLRGAHLEGANLGGAHFEGANLGDAHLERDDLSGAHFEGAFLGFAHLERAEFGSAHLERAALFAAHLEGATLSCAHLEGVTLGCTHLERATLSAAHLEGANLRGADLGGDDLSFAHLERATVSAAHLEGANLRGADLEGATLSGAHLERANLRGADVRADLGGANLEGANLQDAHLEGATLSAAHLERADLGGAHLERAVLNSAHLEGDDLSGAPLEGANLSGAHLEGANLYGADLEGASLYGAHVEGAVLRNVVGMTRAQLESTIGTPAKP